VKKNVAENWKMREREGEMIPKPNKNVWEAS
jgi:hypothetical protein